MPAAQKKLTLLLVSSLPPKLLSISSCLPSLALPPGWDIPGKVSVTPDLSLGRVMLHRRKKAIPCKVTQNTLAHVTDRG